MSSTAALPETMIANVIEKLGNLNEIFKYTENQRLPVKSAQDLKSLQVLVKVKAAAVNIVDAAMASGVIKPEETEFPLPVGKDGAGVVVAVGSEVSKFKPGDEVFGAVGDCGTYAQYALYHEQDLTFKPKSLSFEEAASIPVAGLTVIQAFDRVTGGVKPEHSILIHGGSGATGGFAVLLAKGAFKCRRVYATTSTGNVEYVKSLGADRVIDYTKEKFEDVIAAEEPGKTVDIIIDAVGSGLVADIALSSKKVLTEGGSYVTFADVHVTTPPFPEFKSFIAQANGKDLARFTNALVDNNLSGKSRIITAPLQDLAQVMIATTTKKTNGKYVITIPQ